MKRRIATMVIALPLMAGGYAFAEDSMSPPGKADAAVQADHKVMTTRLSKCVGKNVYNQDGKNIGDIKDIVLDGGTNRISYVVVSYGGVMGMGDKLFAVPWRALEQRSVEPEKMFLNISEASLKDAPGFDKNQWPDMANAAFRDQIDRFYTDAGKAHDKMAKHDTDVKVAEKPGPAKDGLLWCRRVSAVMGAEVRNTSNENLGEIQDIVVDNKTGNVHYAVLSFGGILGMGDKLFAIPISALQTKPDDDKFVLDVTKDRLKNAPGFNKQNWPDFADPQFRSSVDDYYSTGHDKVKNESAKTE